VSKRPNDLLVVAAWVNSIPALRPGICATTLPEDNTTWGMSGFVVETAVGGGPHSELPQGEPIIQLDVHVINPNSDKPPWAAAQIVMSEIYAATTPAALDATARWLVMRTLTLPNSFGTARVLSCHQVSIERRLYGDDASVAVLSADFAFHWVAL
jgi:hypothetical protein